ncbi:reverse transcriptase domain-containing protein [Tanacetum coccineum]
MEIFISGLPRSIEGNVTASKPQTLEEATNIAQRLMDQIIKHDYVQETNNHKRKIEDKGNIIINNNYQNNYNNNNRNNDYHQQQNRRQETFRTYAATNRNKRSTTRNNLQTVSITCSACGKKGHYANQCSKASNGAIGKHT